MKAAPDPKDPTSPKAMRAMFWRTALEEFGDALGVSAGVVKALDDDAVVLLGETMAKAFLAPMADVLGPLVYRGVQAYREAEAQAKYGGAE